MFLHFKCIHLLFPREMPDRLKLIYASLILMGWFIDIYIE
jgi:hypothetical protein